MRSLLSVLLSLVCLGALQAESATTLSGVHLCCGKCDKAVIAAAGTAGVTATVEEKDGTKSVTLKGADDAALTKAVAALSTAGFSGTPANAEVKLPAAPAPATLDGAVVSHLHNCCGKCAKAIKATLGGVAGVTKVEVDGQTATLTGPVDAAVVVATLRKAGMDGSVAAAPAK